MQMRKGVLTKYAVLLVDKANNTYVVHCKQHLARQVVKETTTTKTYEIELTKSD